MDELNEVMINEDGTEAELVLVEDVDEIEAVETGKGWKIGAAIGGIALAGFGIYKGVKWVVNKRKIKKAKADQVDEDEVIGTEAELVLVEDVDE